MLVSLFIYIIIHFSANATHEFSRSVVIIARTGNGWRIPPSYGTIPSLAAVLVSVTCVLAWSNLIVHLLMTLQQRVIKLAPLPGRMAYLLIVTSFSLGSVNILDLLLFIALRSSSLC